MAAEEGGLGGGASEGGVDGALELGNLEFAVRRLRARVLGVAAAKVDEARGLRNLLPGALLLDKLFDILLHVTFFK